MTRSTTKHFVARGCRVMPAAALVLALAWCALLVLVGCAGQSDASRFAGTWDLQNGTSVEDNDALSDENVRSMRALGLEAYLNLDENGSLALVTFDEAKYGSWKTTGATTANATVEGQSANIILEGDALKLTQSGTTLNFSKGDPKDSDLPSGEAQGSSPQSSRTSAGLSEMVVKGALLDEPRTIVDGAICTIVVDGVGTDRLGDPGYNLQVTNNYETPIDVWVLDPFSVDGKDVSVYLFETVDPGRSVTAFMQFDTADLGSMSAGALVNVSGRILIDDDQNETIARYPFRMS